MEELAQAFHAEGLFESVGIGIDLGSEAEGLGFTLLLIARKTLMVNQDESFGSFHYHVRDAGDDLVSDFELNGQFTMDDGAWMRFFYPFMQAV